MFERILVGTDGSKTAARAVDRAVQLAASTGASLTILTAARPERGAKVVEAEAQVPLAMAEAFRNGNLGVMDYARYRNLQSDTAMRESISRPDGSAGPTPA